MPQRITRRALARLGATATVAALAAPHVARAADPIRLRCSLDTAPSHLRNVGVGEYLKKIEDGSGGRIKTELFQSGQLFADRDVSKALVQGQIEMAVPGSWVLAGFVPDADFFQLPVLYGLPGEVVHRMLDGKVGEMVNQAIQQKLRVRVLGGYYDLGYNNWYSTSKPLRTLADLKDMKIRISGGAGQAWRVRFFGGSPTATAWPDVPLALSQGTFDGLITTNESISSAVLWEAGVRHCLEDHQFMAEYIPLVSDAFWGKLPADLQKLMLDTWAQNIGGWRQRMAEAQEKAKAAMQSHGVDFVAPPAEEVKQARARMLQEQDQVAKELKLSPDLVKAVTAQVTA